MRDQVLYGDVRVRENRAGAVREKTRAGIGTRRVGFFPLSREPGDDGEGGEEAVLRAYRAAGFSGVRGVRMSGTLEYVEYDERDWDLRVAGPDGLWESSRATAGTARCVPLPEGARAMIVTPAKVSLPSS